MTDMDSSTIWFYLERFGVPAALTIVLETPVMLFFMRRELKGRRIGCGLLVAYVALVNAITNILLNLSLFALRIFLRPGPVADTLFVAGLEICVVAEECLLYRLALPNLLTRTRCIRIVVVSNVVSFLLGMLLLM